VLRERHLRAVRGAASPVRRVVRAPEAPAPPPPVGGVAFPGTRPNSQPLRTNMRDHRATRAAPDLLRGNARCSAPIANALVPRRDEIAHRQAVPNCQDRPIKALRPIAAQHAPGCAGARRRTAPSEPALRARRRRGNPIATEPARCRRDSRSISDRAALNAECASAIRCASANLGPTQMHMHM
jgi:hypothetical protein